MMKNKTLIAFAITSLLLSSYSVATPQKGRLVDNGEASVTVNALEKEIAAKKMKEVEAARAEIIQQAAAEYGLQKGLAAEAKKINEALSFKEAEYNVKFNFSPLMLEPGFIPPVITESRNNYRQEDRKQARASSMLFKIISPARFGDTPLWQEYLFISATEPGLPDESVLPTKDSEKELWDIWAKKGWAEGQALARSTFEENLARLNRDYQGMARFKMLYEQGLVTKPKMAKTDLGVTGGQDEMAIDERVFEITVDAAFEPNKKNWLNPKPITHKTDLPKSN